MACEEVESELAIKPNSVSHHQSQLVGRVSGDAHGAAHDGPGHVARDHGRRHDRGLMLLLLLLRRHLVPYGPVVSGSRLDELHESILEGPLADAGHADLARRQPLLCWRHIFSLVGLATFGTAVGAGRAIDVDPVRAIMREEVLASVLVEASAATHGD